jgi:hypothetical protein
MDLKISIVILYKNKSLVLNNSKAVDASLMGASLVLSASEKLAKENNISFDEARKIIVDSIIETKNIK